MSNHAKTLYQYNVWANGRIMEHLQTISPEKYEQEIKSVFPSLAKVCSHLYLVEYLWLDILEGKDMGVALEEVFQLQHETDALPLEELEAAYRTLSERFLSFLEKEENLERRILLNNPYVGERETSLAEIVLHAANHGTYHRGNISAMLHQLGDASVMTDFAFYMYQEDL
ncbi:DinB family protein [Halalkalibacterium halodurans]|uniref:DinB family protein n=1 Tax=Halalkalibacterium halodurans TaxID=86665 RepID=UPI002E1CD00F|nr:DinB family protein [Halalkalibacterium halodurans]